MRASMVAAALVVVASLAPVAPTFARQESVGAPLSSALSGLQQATDAITAAQQASTPAAKRQRAQQAIAILEGAAGNLAAVLGQSTTDFVRSRAQATLDQLNEGLADLREGTAGSDATLDSKLNEALAQIQEAIGELKPAVEVAGVAAAAPPVPEVVRPSILPVTGEPAAPASAWQAALLLLSLTFITAGLRLRRL
ncbi:MAG: hypothetical protein HY690_17845 [Chloroflexi bacterium]|nr:hypothetical protein [Chloroflexota bacterium]